jgi:type 1 fimbria pilin
MTFKATVAALAAVCALAGGAANAAVIYSNFGPGYAFSSSLAWVAAGAASFTGEDVTPGMAFSSAIDANVSEITIALANLAGDDFADVSLWTKDLSVTLGTWRVDHLPGLGGGLVTTISGISGVHLDAGADYVLVVKSADDGFNFWNWNSTGAIGDYQVNAGGYNSGTLGAFEIQSGAVPEAGAWALLILGFGGVGAMLRAGRGKRPQPA